MSAIESKRAPKSLFNPWVLAIYPSKTSLMPQTIKITKKTNDNGSVNNKKRDKKILEIVM